jgi:hypothetical protein
MKTFRAKKGPFQERPFYSSQEIEQICVDELSSAGFLPTRPEPVRIERFIEKCFGLTPVYEELPPGVLGYTLFTATGPKKMVVTRVLADEGTAPAERRINTTLAHEAGHCLLHGHLFAMEASPITLFGADAVANSTGSKILCRDGQRVGFYDGKWWEYQANQAIGALLLPRKLVRQAADQFLSHGKTLLPTIAPDARDLLTKELVAVFDVNRIVADIRIAELFPETDQLKL